MMKKMIAVIATLLFTCVLVACNNSGQPGFEETTQESIISSTTETTTYYWPTYMPKDIKLLPDEHFYDQDIYELGIGLRKYRVAYYDIPSGFFNLLRYIDIEDVPYIGTVYDIERMNRGPNGEWVESNLGMKIVLYLKHYNIPKENYIRAIEDEQQYRLKSHHETNEIYGELPLEIGVLDGEEAEFPNPDIIYTFDNEIINAYYRRVNPVEPDWTKLKTYESYEAYLEENP